MRLFIAIDIPEQAKGHLTDHQDPNLGVRWSAADTMHLTLRFIGDARKDVKDRLTSHLSEISHPAFEMTIRGLGYFPEQKHPKVLWAGIAENSLLMNLQEKVEQACRSADLDPDNRAFKPHITIGRVQKASKKEILSFINQNKGLRFEDISVSEFILYESKLHSDGAIHSPLKRLPLNQQTEKMR